MLLLKQELLLERGRVAFHRREGALVPGVLGEEMGESLLECADLALSLLNLLVKLVALPLELLALLRRLDHVIRLGALALVALVAERARDDVVLVVQLVDLEQLVRELRVKKCPPPYVKLAEILCKP